MSALRTNDCPLIFIECNKIWKILRHVENIINSRDKTMERLLL